MSQETNQIFQGTNFKWAKVLSGFNASKTREGKERQFMAGLPGNIPYESDMLAEWNPPFLFYKFFIGTLVMTALIFVYSYMYGAGTSLLVSIVPYMLPVTLLLFIWELNVPRNVSILDVAFITFFSGIICYFVISFVGDITGMAYADYSIFTLPLLSLIARTLLVCVFLRKKSRGYGLNGLVIGAAVGAGYVILTLADDLYYVAEYAGQVTGVMGLMAVRVVMVIGGEIVWTAAIGGALALAKGRESLKGKHLGDSLFLICLIGTYLIQAFWDYDITDFFARFADNKVAVGIYAFLYTYQGKYILLTVLSWALLLLVARKGMVQVIEIAERERAGKRKWDSKIAAGSSGKADIYGLGGGHGGKKFTCTAKPLLFGRDASCGVRFAADAQGISSVHCEIRKQGEDYVLIDRNSTYGTFWENGEQLEPGKAYVLRDQAAFYLAAGENAYRVCVKKEAGEIPAAGLAYGRRTNEIDGAEESGQNVYIACGAALAVMFLVFYMTGTGGAALVDDSEIEAAEESTYYGAWISDYEFNIKDIIANHIDNVIAWGEIKLFKDTWADGITFTEDGMAYCTYNGIAIDYAKFTCSPVDDSTLHLQWEYESMEANLGLPVTIIKAGVSKSVGDEAGFDVKYQLDGNTMQLNFAGQTLLLRK